MHSCWKAKNGESDSFQWGLVVVSQTADQYFHRERVENVAEGRYNLHYFATDCATTEELNFTPSTSASVNWASFKTVPLNVDLHAPIITNTSWSVVTTRSGPEVTIQISVQ